MHLAAKRASYKSEKNKTYHSFYNYIIFYIFWSSSLLIRYNKWYTITFAYLIGLFTYMYISWFFFIVTFFIDWLLSISRRKNGPQKWRARKFSINRRCVRALVARGCVRTHTMRGSHFARRALCTNKLNAFHRRPPLLNASSSTRRWCDLTRGHLRGPYRTGVLPRGLDTMYRSNKDLSKRPRAYSKGSNITARNREFARKLM